MGEVPEHLLKRSAQRRAQLSGDGGATDAPADAPTPAEEAPVAESVAEAPAADAEPKA